MINCKGIYASLMNGFMPTSSVLADLYKKCPEEIQQYHNNLLTSEIHKDNLIGSLKIITRNMHSLDPVQTAEELNNKRLAYWLNKCRNRDHKCLALMELNEIHEIDDE